MKTTISSKMFALTVLNFLQLVVLIQIAFAEPGSSEILAERNEVVQSLMRLDEVLLLSNQILAANVFEPSDSVQSYVEKLKDRMKKVQTLRNAIVDSFRAPTSEEPSAGGISTAQLANLEIVISNLEQSMLPAYLSWILQSKK